MLALLEEVSDFLDHYVDVRDGEDGPLPNKAMTLKAEVDLEIEHMRLAGPVGEVIVTEEMLEAGKDERMACFKTEGRETNPVSVSEALTRIYRAMAKASPTATSQGVKP
jgi:hypothetical protein